MRNDRIFSRWVTLSLTFPLVLLGMTAASGEPPKKDVVTIVTNKGTIVIELYPDVAPHTVENFKKLAKSGFYNGVSFHRYVPGFVIQGGDPSGNGTGGPGYTIKAEFNSKKHLAGTVAMARRADPDSAGSQFYICLAPTPHLDGQYTVFGQVIEGMDVVMQLRAGDIMKEVKVDESAPL